MLEVVQNDITICSRLNKKFNPAVTMILLKLLAESSLRPAIKDQVKHLVSSYLKENVYLLSSS
jgi:hypothetical protein